jgi:hypothetical protein
MKIAVLSDVHANYSALRAVLDDIQHQGGVDAYWFLGDLIGRGFQPVEVGVQMQMLYNLQSAEQQRAWLAGNHEMMLFNRIPRGAVRDGNELISLAGDNLRAVAMIEHNERSLKYRQDICQWLESLPTYVRFHERVFLAHATYGLDEHGDVLVDETVRSYAWGPPEISLMMDSLQSYGDIHSGLVMGGHTHVSGLFQWQQGKVVRLDHHTQPIHQFDLRQDFIYVNVGSVGFPRQTDTCSTYVILTTDAEFVNLILEFRSAAYDVSQVDFPHDYPTAFQDEILRSKDCQ